MDLHTHAYHSATYWGIHADPYARTGVTTWLDAGSAGGYNIMGFRQFIAQPAQCRIFALLNISSIGLTAPTRELANLNYCDVDLCCAMIDRHRDLVMGVKRASTATPPAPMAWSRCAWRAKPPIAAASPLMVHIANGPPDVNDVLDMLRPGDILTHCSTGGTMRIVGPDRRILDAARRAWDRGVIMDLGLAPAPSPPRPPRR